MAPMFPADRHGEAQGDVPAGAPGRVGAEPPIYDPYISAQPPESPQAEAAEGGGGRRRRRRGWLLVIALSSVISTLATIGVVGWAAYHWRDYLIGQEQQNDADAEADTRQTGHSAKATDDKDTTSKASKNDSTPVPSVPDDTKVERRGKIEVVDVGLSSRGLKEVLLTQSSLARARNERLMVMTTGRECKPCQGVSAALDDKRMQQALAGVRLVRVDLKVFKEELAALKMSVDVYPAFFLLGEDMTPIDGIHGGEWDDDVARNMAPVLGPFVRGEYRERRHDWSPTTGGVSI